MSSAEKAQYRRELLQRTRELDDLDAELLLTTWELWARKEQIPPESDWIYWLILAGRGFGKTRTGAEWVRDSAKDGRFQYVNLIGATVDDARDIMIEGESGILACCPRWERPEYLVSKRRLDWPNGARSLIFTADEPERLRGKQHQRVWGDEPAAWRYEEAMTQLKLGLRLPPDPRAVFTTTPKPRPLLRELLERPRIVVTKGTTYDNRENLAPEFYEEIIRQYEGTRLGRQELEAELLLDEGLAYRVEQGVHIVPAMSLPREWLRFEAMDYGSTNPTAWGAFVTDYDGNTIVFDQYYSPGLVSEHAERVLSRRLVWYPPDEKGERESGACFGPPDIKTRFPAVDYKGKEISVESEFAAHGITFAPAQTDRRAGYMRIAEALARKETRRFPDWHPMRGETGAPSLFIVDSESLEPLVKQLRDAPLEDPDSPGSRFPGEAVDQAWEQSHGHAHAMLRYGLMSRPQPSERPAQGALEDPRAEALRQSFEAERKQESDRDFDTEEGELYA